jgi:hypothetical protein
MRRGSKKGKKGQKEQKMSFCLFCPFLPFLLPLPFKDQAIHRNAQILEQFLENREVKKFG